MKTIDNILAKVTTMSYQPPVMLWADYVGAVRQFSDFKEAKQAIYKDTLEIANKCEGNQHDLLNMLEEYFK